MHDAIGTGRHDGLGMRLHDGAAALLQAGATTTGPGSDAQQVGSWWLLLICIAVLVAVIWKARSTIGSSGLLLMHAPQRHLEMGWITLAVTLGLFVVTNLATQVIIVAGGWLERIQQQDGEAIVLLMLVNQLIALPLMLIFAAVWLGRQEAGWRRAGLVPRRPVRELKLGVVGAIVGFALMQTVVIPIAMVLHAMGHEMPAIGHSLLQVLQDSDDAKVRTTLIFSAIIGAPVIEEIVYRWGLQTSLVSIVGWHRRWLGMLAAAFVFGLIHAAAVPPAYLPGLMTLGLMLGWLYERSGSIWPGVIAHALFNGGQVMVVLFLM